MRCSLDSFALAMSIKLLFISTVHNIALSFSLRSALNVQYVHMYHCRDVGPVDPDPTLDKKPYPDLTDKKNRIRIRP